MNRVRIAAVHTGLAAVASVILAGATAWTQAVTVVDAGMTPVAAESASLEATRQLLNRATTILRYAAHYQISGELSAAIYDAAHAEGIHPAIAYQLVKVESRFRPDARSTRGALGYTQVRLPTARMYEPGLTPEALLERDTNLRLGFRFLRDQLRRFKGDLHLALVAYNRGPTLVDSLLTEGEDPGNGYPEAVLHGVSWRVTRAPTVLRTGS